jgi:phytoene synthase
MTDDPRAEEVRDFVREADRDRYLATLFAPPDKRDALLALHAFDFEVGRIPRLARQQIASDIRMQWWREAVDGSNEYQAQANPVAAALTAAIADYDLPRDRLRGMIDHRGAEIQAEAFADTDDLLAWCDGVWGAQLDCACRILDGVTVRTTAPRLVDAGRAIGVTQLLMSFAARAARGQSIVPASLLAAHGASLADVTAGRPHHGVVAALADMRSLATANLQAAGAQQRELPAPLRPALVLLGLVAPRLDWFARHDPYVSGDVAPWRKLWRMWRANKTA